MDPWFETPNLDRLAMGGVTFERAFCTTPQCSPSRSSIFTGRYPSDTGVLGNVGAYGGDPLREPTVAPALQALGYRTGYAGKWHLGDTPCALTGWDVEQGVTDPYSYSDSGTTDFALDFLRSAGEAGQPFALFLSYEDPHDVYFFDPDVHGAPAGVPLPESWHRQLFEQVPAVQQAFMTRDQGTLLLGSDPALWRAYRWFYREKVRLYDAYVGRVLDALEQNGLADHTIVFATSDHGDMDTHHRLIFKGPFMYEHMVRVPLIVRVPAALGGVPGQRIDADAIVTDFVPTLLDFAGAPHIGAPVDGFSLRPLLTGDVQAAARAWPRDYVVGQYHGKQRWVNPIRMIRTADYKYNRYLLHGEELYHLAEDPHELVNLARDPGYRSVKAELAGELDRWIERHADPFYRLTVTDRSGAPLSG